MQRGFGIRIAPCRFRQDNRDYYIDHAGKAISDALTSVKHISRRVANTLYSWRDRFYPCFTDLLYDMEIHPAFDSQVVEILIRLGYFQEFGSSGKLSKLFHEFREGEFKFSKAHIPATQEKRLSILRKLESEMPEPELPIHEQIRFEIAMCGAPFTTVPNLRSEYAVLEVDDRYSPKIRLYNIATGRTGVMKLKKVRYQKQPLAAGDVIRVLNWLRRPAYSYTSGKPEPVPGRQDLWLLEYEVLQ